MTSPAVVSSRKVSNGKAPTPAPKPPAPAALEQLDVNLVAPEKVDLLPPHVPMLRRVA